MLNIPFFFPFACVNVQVITQGEIQVPLYLVCGKKELI